MAPAPPASLDRAAGLLPDALLEVYRLHDGIPEGDGAWSQLWPLNRILEPEPGDAASTPPGMTLIGDVLLDSWFLAIDSSSVERSEPIPILGDAGLSGTPDVVASSIDELLEFLTRNVFG